MPSSSVQLSSLIRQKRHAFSAHNLLYWLPGTSVPKIENLVYLHPSIFLCHMILTYGGSSEILLLHERKALL
jgi:hypothetical protein